MKKRMLLILLVLMTITVTAALPGCGGGNESNSSTVVVGIAQDLDSLDPHNAAYAGTKEVLFNVFEGLVKANPDGEIVPAVASSYDVSEDAKVYSFTLRDGITFHDGSNVTVSDIKYSIERYAESQGDDSAFSIISEVAIVDDSTVEIRLSEGSLELLPELTCAIMPESNDANVETNPVGTGPFKFVSFTAGESFVVEKNDSYWNKDLNYVDEVEFKVVTDADTAMMELKAGTLDIYQYLTSDQADILENDFNIVDGYVNYVQGLYLNNSFGPLSDVKVRQAICYAVDRDMINDQLQAGKAAVLGTNMIQNMTKYYNADTETTYSVDVQKAKTLLSEAGYPNGFDLKITVPTNYALHAQAAEIIVENLKEIGINATIETVDFNTWYSQVYCDRKYEATVVAVDGTLAPHSWFAKNVSTADNNFTNYNNAEFDAIYAQAVSSTDEAQRVELYSQLQTILANDAASAYLVNGANLVAVSKRLTGYKFYPISAQDMSLVDYAE